MLTRPSTLDTVTRHTVTMLALTGVLAPDTLLPYRRTSRALASATVYETGVHSMDGQCPSGTGDIAWVRVADVCDPTLLAAAERLTAPARTLVADHLPTLRAQHQRTAAAHQYRFCSCLALLDLLREHTNDETISAAAWASCATFEVTAPPSSDPRQGLYVLNDYRLIAQHHSGGVAPTTAAFSSAVRDILHTRVTAPISFETRRTLLDLHLRNWVSNFTKARNGGCVAYPELIDVMLDAYPDLNDLATRWFAHTVASDALVEQTWETIVDVKVWRRHLTRHPARVMAVEDLDLVHDIGRAPLLCDVRVAQHELIMCLDERYSAAEVVRANIILDNPSQDRAMQHHLRYARTIEALRASTQV